MHVALVKFDDWEGLYIDGKLAREEHSLNLWSVLSIIQDKCEEITALEEVDVVYDLADHGNLPESFVEFLKLNEESDRG